MSEKGATPATSEIFPSSLGSSAARRARVAPVETPTIATSPFSASGLVQILRAATVAASTVRGVILSSVRPGRSGTTARKPALAKPSARCRTAGNSLPSGTVPLTTNIAGQGPSPDGLRDQRGVSCDARIGEARFSARRPDGRREDRGVEDGGDHHHATSLRVNPRPERDGQADERGEQHHVEGAPKPPSGVFPLTSLPATSLSQETTVSIVTMQRGSTSVHVSHALEKCVSKALYTRGRFP